MLNRLKNYIFLYGAHALKVFSFVILTPHFTYVFSKDTWGHIIIIQALGIWLQMLIEYGFNLSATRNMARVKNDTYSLAYLVSGVLGAKTILSCLAFFIAYLLIIFDHNLGDYKNLLIYATLFAIIQGFSPVWYFMARENFSQYASIDFFTRLFYLIGCLCFIKNPQQSSWIFMIGSLTGFLANFLGYHIIFKQVPMIFPKIRDIISMLKDGFGMFIFVSLTSIYTTLNVVILGLSQSATTVAVYGTADKIVRAAGGLLDPINRVVYSKLSFLYYHEPTEAMSYLKKAAVAIFLFGFFIFLIGELLSKVIIDIISPNYPEALPYLKILLLYIPILALNNIVGLHIMLPLGMDKLFNIVFASISLISVVLMMFVVPVYGTNSMAIITILAEVLAFLGMLLCILQQKSAILQKFSRVGERYEQGDSVI